jgi:hypothetical protein
MVEHYDLHKSSMKIKAAYEDVEKALKEVGTLLRTETLAMWSTDHKSAVTGLRIVIKKLRESVPNYKP